MSERYSYLYTLPQNLYTIGSPVVISAGTLLKDNQNGRIIAQLKFRSISNKIIKAVKVKLDLFDTAGNPIGESVVYDYLDLSVSRDVEFGQKTPVPVSDSKARSYNAAVTEVVFGDRSVWTEAVGKWEPLSIPQRLILDDELFKQYQITFGNDSKYEPKEEKDLWYCTCGELNRKGEMCHACHNTLLALQALDMSQLEREKEARLSEEARAAAEKAKKEAEENAAKEAAAEIARKKTAKNLKIVISVFCALVAFYFLLNTVIFPAMEEKAALAELEKQYNEAVSLMKQGNYEEAIIAFEVMSGYKDSKEKIATCKNAVAVAKEEELEEAYISAEALANDGEIARAAIAFGKLGDYSNARERSFALWAEVKNRETISAGLRHTVGLYSDGTVVATQYASRTVDYKGQCDVDSWSDIVAISARNSHTVGLHSDGTVVAVGSNKYGQYDVSKWRNIVTVSAGRKHTVGLCYDGTVVAVGDNEYGQCDVSHWADIVAISAGYRHTVGLRGDGTVVAVGFNDFGRCDIVAWKNIIAVSAGGSHTVGLNADGTVVAVGNNEQGQCNVSEWKDIVAISAGEWHTIGLRSDGSVVSTGSNYYGRCDVDKWTDIVAISAETGHTVGLRSDGSVVAVGNDENGQCDVLSWKNIKLPN